MNGNSAQAFSVKRAQVEFHNFASLGEPARALRVYAEENQRRGAMIRKHLEFIGPMSPFLEIGANAGHTSYMVANEFGADGFALDISADALRHGLALQDEWGLARSPIRVAGDAVNLPFADGSLRLVMTFQTLSQFMDLEAVFLEVKRVLAPGGVFFFSEEPLKRMLSMRLYRCPYYETMKPWERKLFDWGLLDFFVRDVIGAHQEESFGIRQNHTMALGDWDRLVRKHFAAQEYELFVPERGWGERVAKRLAVAIDPYRSVWTAGKLLGGTVAAVCRKAGVSNNTAEIDRFESLLRCPDCHSTLERNRADMLSCSQCGYSAGSEGGVYNLLPSAERRELYPGDRDDVIDFSQPGHEAKLLEGWHALEGVYGNKYRWIGERATARLKRVTGGPLRLRIRGHAESAAATIEARVNGVRAGMWKLDRSGLFILEAPVPEAAEYLIEILAAPKWQSPGDKRIITVTVSMIRLIPIE